MLQDPRSHGLWETTAPAAPETRPLDGELRVDVAVVGAGYTGLSAALHLAERGASVAVLEAAGIGFGGSGRNVGLVNAGLWVMPDDIVATLGAERGERLLALLGEAPAAVFDLVQRHAIACEAERAGTLHCAVGDKGFAELAERARQWQARGAPVELVDAAEAARLTGTSAYAGALLDHRAGTIQPLAYARGLACAALAAGAAIHTDTPVTALAFDGAVHRLTTPHGQVTARQVIAATNAYSSAPFAELREEVVALPYFNIATRPLSSNVLGSILPGRQGCWDTNEVLSSFRLDRSGRLIIGSVGALRGTGAAIHRRWARRSLRRLFPQLGDVAFDAEWYGRIGMTTDSLPRFHRSESGIASCSGYNGRGIGPGTVFGRLLAQSVLGVVADADLPLPVMEIESPRWRVLKEGFYEVGSQFAHVSSRI
ncbi:FAD-binding oxidoreductase [Aurantimonas sp. 22II-16-19i]|uniref:NAD(P)/FAD-dependent oxidoreductase n=1 Tax=Aurantimonas sp. 22II-16-19i TaxID=1317114 RepID=UPI0009FB6430|nr:FAD-binding oxidoreductase [Aurantimonas sp. 22II-16-19i]